MVASIKEATMPQVKMRAVKPKYRQTTIKALADRANRFLKPESEEPAYEFANGRVTKKRGRGPYPTT